MAPSHLSRRQVLAVLGGALGTGLFMRSGIAAVPGPHRYPDITGSVRKVAARHADTLLDIMRKYNLGYVEIVVANPGVDPWLPGDGTEIVLPMAHILPDAPREGLVLNLSEQRLYYFPAGSGPVESFAIGIGSEGWTTPMGRTTIVRKQKDPTWHVPKSILKVEPDHKKVVLPGPNNPLGKHALYLGWPAYLIHGTNMPDAVGRRASHGCINMYPEGVETLFNRVPIGTVVTVVDQQAKLAWSEGGLYIQVHPSAAQADQIEESGSFTFEPVPELEFRVNAAAGNQKQRLDWASVEDAVKKRNGVPVRITRDAPA